MKIKAFSFLFGLIILSNLTKAQDKLTITGTVSNSLNNRTLILAQKSSYWRYYKVIDTLYESIITKGNFSFNVNTNKTDEYFIYLKDKPAEAQILLLSPLKTIIHFADTSLNNPQVIGNDIYAKYKNSQHLLNRGMFIEKEVVDNISNFIEKDPSSEIGSFLLENSHLKIADTTLEKLTSKLTNKAKNNIAGDQLDFLVANTHIGKQMYNFKQTDTARKEISLSDLKGKYILLEFWASWCKPCREENPHLIKLFNKYRNSNFDVINYTTDTDRKAWLKAIKDDGLSEMKHMNEIDTENYYSGSIFRLLAIPRNYLIDPTGKIIAKDIWGKKLDEMMESLNLL
ncbi:MAG: AhpC/TSA family protein [Flavobacterium sp.]|nr:MAG: AhpC/TSA family protein [Flavobacterium sp.]